MLNCETIITAAHIVTQNENRKQLVDSAIVIDNGIIIDIGLLDIMRKKYNSQQEIDLGNALLMPGLVNTHTHSSMTYARGIADDLPLMQWLEDYIFPLDKRLNEEIVEIGAQLGFAEMLRTGTTACIDMSICAKKVLKAAEQSGIRCLGGETIFQFPSLASSGGEATFDNVHSLAQKYHKHTRIHTCVAIHSVYTTSPELLEKSLRLAQTLNLPIHMHLSETIDETLKCEELWGKRPVDLCHSVGLLQEGTSFAHVVDVTDDEIDLLAKNKVSIAHNVSSNMKLASGIAPIAKMHEKGLCVGIATDSACSNNHLNMFTEMRATALLHKVQNSDPTILPAQVVMDMATRDGGTMIKRFSKQVHENILGVIDVGHPADLIAIDLNEPNMQPMYNPVSHVVYAATGMEVKMTMVEGEVLYHDGKFSRFDYTQLMEECKKMQEWVLRNKI